MMQGKGLISFFCMWISTFSNIICWKDKSFLTESSWHPCQKSFEHICNCLFVGSWFYSTDLYICLYATPYYFDHSRFEISFKIRKCEKSNFILFFFFRSFWLVRSLQIPHEFYYGFFYVCKIMSLDFALILDAFNHCVKSNFNPPLSEDFHGFPTSWRWYFMRIFHFSCHTRKLK